MAEQERDAQGRFGSGGGGTTKSSGKTGKTDKDKSKIVGGEPFKQGFYADEDDEDEFANKGPERSIRDLFSGASKKFDTPKAKETSKNLKAFAGKKETTKKEATKKEAPKRSTFFRGGTFG